MRRARFVGMLCLIAGCNAPISSPEGKTSDTASPGRTRIIDIGAPLFAGTEWPTRKSDPATVAIDPIVVPSCHLTVIDKADIPSQEEGTIAWVGTPLKSGEAVDKRDIYIHPRTGEKYRRLRPGDKLEAQQVVAVLNDLRAAAEVRIAEGGIRGAEAEFRAASSAIKHYQANLDIQLAAQRRNAATPLDVISAQANLARYEQEEAAKQFAVEKAKGEKERAEIRLSSHLLKSSITGEVVQIMKQPGEGLKAAEPVLQVQNLDRLRVEGYLERQYVGSVELGQEVLFEPDLLAPPAYRLNLHSGKTVTAVVGTMRQGKPMFVSGGEDNTAQLWTPRDVSTVWRHPAPVRSVAVTRADVEPALALTGCEDGRVRVWELDSKSDKPLRELSGVHDGGCRACAFSPDGKYAVTGDDRGDLFLFEISTGTLKYRFPHEHNSGITSLTFLPEGRVLSCGRDQVAFLWTIGTTNAKVETPFEHRTGDVPVLGVTDDGGCMLLDQDKNRLNIAELPTGRSIGLLQTGGDGAKFVGFALFSPTIGAKGERVILTGGSNEGVVQLWRESAGRGRGAEIRKLVCDGYIAATCAAFSPQSQDGLIAIGTRKGEVQLWPMPTVEDLAARFPATVTHLDRSVDPSGKTVRIVVEFDNPKDEKSRLRPGTSATMIIPQR